MPFHTHCCPSLSTEDHAEIERLRGAIQEAGTLLDFEINLGPGDHRHRATLRDVLRQLTEALERPVESQT